MKLGPYHVRLGHQEEDKKELHWIDEMSRFCAVNHRYCSCSFYVPVLTPIVLAFKRDSVNGSTGVSARQPIRVTVNAGSTSFSDVISATDYDFHLYGGNTSSTGREGKDVSLLASEENITIVITDEEGARELATFEYKHLLCDEVPKDIDLAQINYEHNSPPLAYHAIAVSKGSREVHRQQQCVRMESDDDEEIDELVDSDGDTVITEEGATKRQPTTPVSNRIATSTTLTPQFKKMGRASQVKNEQLELQLSPSKQPSPANLVKKETEHKIVALKTELQVSRLSCVFVADGSSADLYHFQTLKDQTQGLGEALKKKEAKAKAACDRAIVRAQEEHDSVLRKNTDMIEELEVQLEEHAAVS